MNRYIIILDGNVVDVVKAEAFDQKQYSGKFMTDYDTVTVDNKNQFNVGDVYHNIVSENFEVVIENEKYRKHVSFGNKINGLSFIDSSYRVTYVTTNDSDTNLFMFSERENGVKNYYIPDTSTPLIGSYTKDDIIYYAELVQGDTILEREWYIGLDKMTSFEFTNPFSQSQINLILSNPEKYKTVFSDKPFVVSVKDDASNTTNGYISLTEAEIQSVFSIDTSTWLKPELPVYEVSPRQVRLQLINEGLYDQALALIDSLTGNEKLITQTEWKYATVFKIYHPLIIQFAQQLGIDRVQFFKNASKL